VNDAIIETPTVELVPALPDELTRETYLNLARLALAAVTDKNERADWEDDFGIRHDGADFDTALIRLWPVVAAAGYRRTQDALDALADRYGDDTPDLVAAIIGTAEEHADWTTAMQVRLHLARVQAVLDPAEAIALRGMAPGRWCVACGAPTTHVVLLVTSCDHEFPRRWELSLCEPCTRRHPGAAAVFDDTEEPSTPEDEPLPLPRRFLSEDTGLGWRDLVECRAEGPLWAARHRGRTVYTDRWSMWDVELMGLRVHESFPAIEDGQTIHFLEDSKTQVSDDPEAAVQLDDAWGKALPLDFPNELELKRWEPARVTWSDYYTDTHGGTGITGLIGTTGDGRVVGLPARLAAVAFRLGLTAYLAEDGTVLRWIGADLDDHARTVGALRTRAVDAAAHPVLGAIAAAANGSADA
jgi:hypothetical protein